MNLYEDLMWRGLIKDVAGEDLENKLNNESITFYWGTDPTADSLHLGHYSSLITAKRLSKHGHNPILLVGGATGLIGDPRPTAEREIISQETIDDNLTGISNQVNSVLENKATIVNNYDWTNDISFLEMLRDIGKYINVNYLLSKDIIKRRLDSGITYAEFSYTLLQGNDFLHLFKEHNCTMQVAGSDQWGNITTGIELIRKKLDKEAYGFTMPLILDKNGNKFGKSEGNALWLDKNKTSSYELYQYLINLDDELIMHYLKVFTFLNKDEIEAIEVKHLEAPELRLAQKTLAKEIISELHGAEEFEKALNISNSLFNDNIVNLKANDIISSLSLVPQFNIVADTSLLDLLVNNKICSSKREAREMISSQAISINNKVITDLEFIVTKDLAIDNLVVLIKKGKKKFYLGKF